MHLIGRVERIASNFKLMTAIAVALSLALPLVMYQSARWHREAVSYAGKVEQQFALKAISTQASEHIKTWSEVKSRMPLPETGSPASNGNEAKRTTQMGVNIENQRTSRTDADRVLEGLSQNTDGQFVPDAFLVRALNKGEGIFVRNSDEDSPGSLALTIKGEFISRDLQ